MKILKKIIWTAFYFICFNISNAQGLIEVVLQKKIGIGNLTRGISHLNLKDTSNYISPTIISNHIIKRYSIQKEQLFFEEFSNSKISKSEFEIQLQRISNPEYSNRKFNHYVDILIGIDKAGKDIFVIDRNRNQNFVDEEIIFFNKKETYKTELDFQFYKNNSVYTKKVFVEFFFSSKSVKYGTDVENKYFIQIGLNEHYEGRFEIEQSKFQIELNNSFVVSKYGAPFFQSLISTSESPKKVLYQIGDLYKLNNGYFKLDSISVSGDTLFIKVLKMTNDLVGFREGWLAPQIIGKDTSNNIVEINFSKSKYSLIDFWASWCKPCREKTPLLKDFYAKFKPKGLELYGLSLDEEMSAWINATKKDKIHWTNASELKGWESQVVRNFNIDAIPLYVLINSDGKILLRETDYYEFEKRASMILNSK